MKMFLFSNLTAAGEAKRQLVENGIVKILIYLNLCFFIPLVSKPPLQYNQAPQTNSYLRPEGSVASNKNIPEVKSIQW